MASLMSVTKLSAGEGDHENFGPRRIGEREQSIARPRTRSPSVVGECSTLEIDERRLVFTKDAVRITSGVSSASVGPQAIEETFKTQFKRAGFVTRIQVANA